MLRNEKANEHVLAGADCRRPAGPVGLDLSAYARHRVRCARQAVGIKEVEEDIWLVSFMDYDLVYIDPEEKIRQSLDNPFGPKVIPI